MALLDTKKFNLAVMLIISIFIIILLDNRLSNTISSMNVDEVHTLVWGSKGLNSVPTARVGESTRWMARILSPIGKYYISTKMGGEHYLTGWDYAGGYYLAKHFKDTNISHDPILQDYVHIMTLLLGSLAVLSFFLVGVILTNQISLASGIAYITLPFSSALVWSNLTIFYTETTLIIAFNLIVATFFLPKNNLRLYLLLSFLAVFSISTKLTGVFFIIPICYVLYNKDRARWDYLKIEGFIFLSLVIFYLWNIPSGGGYDTWVDYMAANVYHLKTGHLNTDTTNQISRIFTLLSPWVYIYFVSLIINIMSPFRHKMYWIIIAFLPLLMILPMMDTAFMLSRNFTTPLVIMILSISISLGILYGKFPHHTYFKYVFFLPIVLLFYVGKSTYVEISDDVFVGAAEKCGSPAIISMDAERYPKALPLNAMPSIFNMREQKADFLKPFEGDAFDCVFVYGAGNNKHFTHYLLPEVYRLKERKGEYFYFSK